MRFPSRPFARRRVGIFVGGVQKGGTTSLHSYLATHPELLAPARKETHFFDDETISWEAPDYRVLHGFYRRLGRGRAFDSTPIYLFWPPSLPRIAAYNPDARLIFLFRDPIERAWSHWRMEYARAWETLPFADAIRGGRDRLRGLPPLHPDWRVYSYVERGVYGRQVGRLLGLFPRDRLLFLRSTDLKAFPGATLEKVASFLGIGPFPDTSPRRDQAAPEIEYPSRLADEDVVYLRELFRPDTAEFARLSGLDVSDWPTMTAGTDGEERMAR